ncbi:Asp23/Gls24 family envelope stress response protein [Streptomyces sp. STR69]|uniref:Asp23/Gls24 family envelope stress response protein n=1 Tax=Streptomyces sp. STR69 TaxID=1796942 RepID=UPI0021C64AFD|nr:Asp23/Gls24 family envelope stress response protein [Streptomyces sp. STR69]
MTAHNDPLDDAPGSEDEHLACGRLISSAWEAWEQQAQDPHLLSCPHCRRAVSELEALETAVRGLRDDAADPSGDDVATLTQRVMDVVRLELRPGRPMPLGEPGENLWIMEAVAARSLRAAAERVPGVRAGSCRLVPGPDADETAAVEVRLDVHAPSGAVLPDLAEQVRRQVWAAADRELGMAVASVDIRITDLVDTPADSQEGSTP